MQLIQMVIVIIVIIYSAIIHEVMHGVAANALGDPTARYAGRLTLNPLKHLDPFGSVILPFLLVLSNSPIFFAYAKPVPYNPYNLKPGRWSESLVAFAGPASNFAVALVFGLILRLGIFSAGAAQVMFLIVVINIMLCFFNLIPIPPLDGSKVIEGFLPRAWVARYVNWRFQFERNPLIGMIIVVLIVYGLGSLWGNVIYGLAQAIAGM